MWKGKPRALVAISLVALVGITSRARADDVLLVDGGRVRGRVTEESPKDGVKVVLADGTVQVVPAAQVKEVRYDSAGTTVPPVVPTAPIAAATPARAPTFGELGKPTATVTVHAAGAGEVVTRDRGKRGSSFESRGRILAGDTMVLKLTKGTWQVRVNFDDEGSGSETLDLEADSETDVHLASWVIDREGVHFGLAGYGRAFFVDGGALGGPMIRGYLNARLGTWGDLRVGGSASLLGGNEFGSLDDVARAVSWVGNIDLFTHIVFDTTGGVYRPFVGAAVGGYISDWGDCTAFCGTANNESTASPILPGVSIEGSVANFHFGRRRNLNLTFGQSFTLIFDVIHQTAPLWAVGLNGGFGAVFY